jgi:Ca2+-binding EF-hand superfamily protein
MRQRRRIQEGLAGATLLLLTILNPNVKADMPAAVTPVRQPSTFQRMDADGNGKVAVAEFLALRNAWFKQMDGNGDGKLTTDEYVKRRQAWFRDMDSNGDGAVVMEEWIVFLCGPAAKLDKEVRKARNDKSTLFETMDADDDGFVVVSELTNYIVVVFRQIDANGDGKLTPEEFADDAGKRFAAMDADRDNMVPKVEFDALSHDKKRGVRAPETNLPAAK